MSILKGCSRTTLLLAAGAALSFCLAGRLQDNYELGVRTQLFTEALASGRSRDIYWMFCPQFRTENSFQRFDSSFKKWYAGRRVKKASRKVVEVSGVGGYVSTWVVFEGASDYDYLYQSWLHVGRTWQLLWVSRILDNSFQYGTSDTAEVTMITIAALRYALSPRGLNQFHARFRRPDTLVLIRGDGSNHPGPQTGPGENLTRIDNTVLLWMTSDEIRRYKQSHSVRFVMGIVNVRLLGTMATAGIDLYPSDETNKGRFGKRRGMQIYLEKKAGSWAFQSSGKTW
jgi:hypothetical protein